MKTRYDYDGAISLRYSNVNSAWLGMWHEQVLRVFPTLEEAKHWANQLMAPNVSLLKGRKRLDGFGADRAAPPKVEYKHWIEPEDQRVRGNVLDSGDSAADEEQERWVINELESGNEAAWCQAMVEAEITYYPAQLPPPYGYETPFVRFVGRDSLGGCSFQSEKQLWKDLLPDMKSNAFEDLVSKIRKYVTLVDRGLSAEENRRQNEFFMVEIDRLLEENS